MLLLRTNDASIVARFKCLMQARDVFQLFHIGCRADRPQEGSCSAHGLIGIQEIWMRARVGVCCSWVSTARFRRTMDWKLICYFCRARKMLHFYFLLDIQPTAVRGLFLGHWGRKQLKSFRDLMVVSTQSQDRCSTNCPTISLV